MPYWCRTQDPIETRKLILARFMRRVAAVEARYPLPASPVIIEAQFLWVSGWFDLNSGRTPKGNNRLPTNHFQVRC